MTTTDAFTPPVGNIECEQALLGALLLNNDLYQRIAHILSADHFYDPLHARLYKIMSSRIGMGDIVDARTIKSFLNANAEIGEITVRDYVARLVSEAASFEVEGYARRIISDSVYRRLLDVASAAQTAVLERDPEDTPEGLLSKIESEFAALRESHHVGAPEYTPTGTVRRAMEMIGAAHRGERVGWGWCLPEVSRIMDGPMQPGNLYGLLGSSGDGKTSFVLQSLSHLAEKGIPFLFLSGEQEPEQCVLQMHAQRLGIPLSGMLKRDGLSDDEADRIFEDAQAIRKLPWAIEKWTACRVGQLGMKIRGFVKRYGPGVVAIDHAKKILPDNPRESNLAQAVAQVFGGVKDVMGESGCAGLLLMQRNSEFLKRRDMRPTRGDCYGGEGTLQNLDGCLTLYRPSRWLDESIAFAENQKAKERIEMQSHEEAGRAWFGNLKNRFGEEGRRDKVQFAARFTRFVSYEERRAALAPELI